ncbi:MAG TPA: YheU family protein [Gammaproteobacteria bacterium]|nr:YheU family protein [Gammaproteobacteria bacterium]
MLIPHKQLSPDTLNNLIEEFVSRDGTDYGAEEIPFTQKTEQVLRLLQQGEIAILFDEETGSCNIVPCRELAHHGIREAYKDPP